MPDSTQVVDQWAELASRAINMTEGAVGFIASKAQELAPDLWRMTAEKLWAEAIVNMLWAIPFVICVTVFIICLKRINKDSYGDDKEDMYIALVAISGTAGLILLVVTTFSLGDLIKLYVAQDFYVLQEVLRVMGIS